MASRIYLDYNATTPVHPEILPLVTSNLSKLGNPSSVHWAGRESKKIITQARESVAALLHCDPLEIIFTSGGSEGNNLALKGAIDLAGTRNEIICSEVEHPSIIKTCEALEAKGFKIHWLKVSRDGEIDLEGFEKMLSEKTALVTCQLVNNETGNIFPLKKMARLARQAGALIHSDMVQALGKMQIDLKAMDVDFASFAGHKFYALKGAGLLFVKKGIHVEPLIHGGGQERARRAGTENALAIASLGDAAKILGPRIVEQNLELEKMRDALQMRIVMGIPGSHVNGEKGRRVSNTLNVTFDNVDGETLLINLDTKGFAVSSGAACSSGSQEPSPVLTAMGLTPQEASQSLRISLGWLTTQTEIDNFFEVLVIAVAQIRKIETEENIERELA
jgi:cysteine desulfurase